MNCQHCNATFPDENQKFCGTCGTPRHGKGASVGDDDLSLRIRSVFNEERAKWFKDAQAFEVEVASKAFIRLRTWLIAILAVIGLIASGFAILGSLIAFLGYGSYKDFTKKANEATQEVDQLKENARKAWEGTEKIFRKAKRITTMATAFEEELGTGLTKVKSLKAELDRIAAGQRQVAQELFSKNVVTQLTAFHTYLFKLKLVADSQITVKATATPTINHDAQTQSEDVIHFDKQKKRLVFSSRVTLQPNIGLIEYAKYTLSTSIQKKVSVTDLLAKPDNAKSLGTTNAIGEGLAYYLTARSNKDTSTISVGPDMMLKLENKLTFNTHEGQPHSPLTPLVWGGLFWDVRNVLGHEVADTLLTQTWLQLTREDITKMEKELFAKKILEEAKGLVENQTRVITKSATANIAQKIRERGIEI